MNHIFLSDAEAQRRKEESRVWSKYMKNAVSRLALKIVVGGREQGTGMEFWAILLFFTYLEILWLTYLI
jgi:abortive infection bacteriophage resistance protein